MLLLALTLNFWVLVAQDPVGASASDGLATAKALYASADYEEALTVLSTLNDGHAADEADQYRALCLLALGRMVETERSLESLIVRNPSFSMSESNVPPRLVAMFREARRRLLPGIVQNLYAAANARFEQRDYAGASSRFRGLMALLADQSAMADENGSTAADLQVLAAGFLQLAETAMATATEPVSAAPATRLASQEEAAISLLVRQYAQAYSARDADGVARLFQDEHTRPLQAAFDGLKSQTIEARNVRIALDADGLSATVTLTWAVEAVPKVGGPRRTQMPATLRLLKSATGEWRIVERR